jgi:histidyl-tRNA synthetase
MAKSQVVTRPPKGTRDYLPADLMRRRYVVDLIRREYELHGFEPLETPTYERLDTLLGKYGDEGDQLVFKILHRGQPLVQGIRNAAEHLAQDGAIINGRSGETAPGAEGLLADFGVRYDLTVPLARVVAEHRGKIPNPFKRYQIQPVWRADTPGKGRFREFYQCDLDIVGSSSRMVEAEVLGAVAACIRKLGFENFAIRINHRGLLSAMVSVCGIDLSLESEVIIAVDKLDKIGPEGVAKALESKGVSLEARTKLLALVSQKISREGLQAEFKDHAAGLDALADLNEVFALLEHTPAAEYLRFDLSLARGLGYYTGAIFEIAVEDLAGSLGGGGRYDGLIGMFGKQDVPACGFSIGLERILVVMEQRNMFPESMTAVDVLLGTMNLDFEPQLLALATKLRSQGLRVDVSTKKIKPGKFRKLADETGCPFALWFEPDQCSSVSLWKRESSSTELLAIDKLLSELRSN